MATYDFRILLETKQGKQFSYISESFYNSAVDTNNAVSASSVWNRITGSLSCSYQNDYIFSGSNPGTNFNQNFIFKNNHYISASLNGNSISGSIQFYTNGITGSDGDSLRRFKFIGEKVCTALGIPHDLWQFTDEFRLVSGDERHYFRGDIVADSLSVIHNMAISNLGNMDSDLPFKIDKESDRYIKFQLNSASVAPRNDLMIGYNDNLDQYWISASDDVTFNIGGVNNLDVTNLNTTTTNTTVIESNISSSGDSHFGDANTDKHIFTGNVGIQSLTAPVWPAPSVSHSVDGLTVAGDISASGDLYLPHMGKIAKTGRSDYFIQFYTNAIFFHVGHSGLPTLAVYDTSVGVGIGNRNGNTDVDFFVSSEDDDNLFWIDNGEDKVAIGKQPTSTDKRFTVVGDISASGDYYIQNGRGIQFADETSVDYYMRAHGGMIRVTNPLEQSLMVISSSGVGIGATIADVPKTLTVEGSISASGHYYLENNKYIYSKDIDGTTQQIALLASDNNLHLGDVNIETRIYGDGAQLFLSESRFGMGNSEPPKTLTVAGDISASGEIFLESNKEIVWLEGTSTEYFIRGMTAGGIQILSGSNSGGATSLLRVSASGGQARIGIGTLYPTKALQVTGDISASGDLYINDISASGDIFLESNQYIKWEDTNNSSIRVASQQMYISADGTLALQPDGDLTIHTGTTEYVKFDGGTQRVHIGSDIGNDDPAKTLTVDGDISASGDLYLDGTVKSLQLSKRLDGSISQSYSGSSTGYLSETNLTDKWKNSLASKEYVYSQDFSDVYSGNLIQVDSDDQGGHAYGVWADGNFVYLANNTRGLEVYSVSSAGILTHIGYHDPGDNANNVWGDGNFIYLANGTGGLHVYSVSSTGTLTHIDSDFQGGGSRDVWGDGNFIYVANLTSGLSVYSVSSTGILTHIDSDDQGGSAFKVWGDGNFIYLANGPDGLEVYSVSSTGTLTHIGNDDPPGAGPQAYGVWGDGKFIYMAYGSGGLHVYSVSSTGTLTHIGSDDQGGTAYDVWGDGNFIYLANSYSGIETYSVSSAGILTQIGDTTGGGGTIEIKRVWGDGNFIYSANSAHGLSVYKKEKAYEYVASGSTTTTPTHYYTGDISASGNIYLENNQSIIWPRASGVGQAPSILQFDDEDELHIGTSGEMMKAIKFEQGWGGIAMYITGSYLVEPLIGINTSKPSKTLTVNGDISASGDLYVSSGSGVILTSEDGTQYKLVVANGGALSTVEA